MATIIKSIGTAAGRDYATIQAFLDAIPTDVVASGNVYIGELYNDSEFNDSNGRVNLTGKTTNATYNITLRAAAGQGFANNPNRANNALWYNQANGVAIKNIVNYDASWKINQAYTTIDGIQLTNTGVGSASISLGGTGSVAKNCIFVSTPDSNVNSMGLYVGANTTYINCLIVQNLVGSATGVQMNGGTMINCTLVHPTNKGGGTDSNRSIYQYAGTNVVKNCAIFGFNNRDILPNTFSASDYNATDWNQAPGGTSATHNQLSLTYANQFVNTTNDFRIKAGSDLIDKGMNLSATYGSTDVYGSARPTLWDVGMYELPVPASALSLNGPSLGKNLVASADFTITANGFLTSSVTITPSDGGDGGTFNPASVTLPAGSNSSVTFKYTPASVGIKTISLANNATLNNPPVWNYTSAKAATKVSITAPTGTSRAGTQSGDFTIALDGVVDAAVKVIFNDNNGGGSFNPAFLSLDNTTTSGTFKYIGASGGTKTVTFTNDGGLANNSAQITLKPPIVAVPTQSSATVLVKTIGTGKDFATVRDFADFARTYDLTANNVSLIGEVYENGAMSSASDLGGYKATSTNYVILQPVPGLSVADLDKGDPLTYGTEGIELTIGGTNTRIGYGAVVQGFRINLTSAGNLSMSGFNNVNPIAPTLRRNRIKSTSSSNVVVTIGEYLCPGIVQDNLIIVGDGTAGNCISGNGQGTVVRNTFVRLGTSTMNALNLGNNNNFQNQDLVGNNAFVNFSGVSLINNVSGYGAGKVYNNYTDAAPTAAITGVFYTAGAKLVKDVTNDFRPDPAGVLVGNASSAAIDVPDIYNVGRGGIPDVGCVQGSVLVALSKVDITTQTVNGQTVTVSGTATNSPISGVASLLPDDTTPNGAVTQGPTNITLDSGQGTYSVTWNNVPAGNYKIPSVKVTNAGGTNITQTGGEAVNIIAITASAVAAEAPPSIGNAPVIAFSQNAFDNTTLAVQGTVDIQGDANCVINAYVDPQPSGASLGPFKANIFGNTWAVQLSSLPNNFKVRLVGTANGKTTTVTSDALKIINCIGTAIMLPIR